MAKKITYEQFEEAVKTLGEFIGEELSVDGTPDEQAQIFVDAINEKVTAEMEKDFDDDVAGIYNAIVDKGAAAVEFPEPEPAQAKGKGAKPPKAPAKIKRGPTPTPAKKAAPAPPPKKEVRKPLPKPTAKAEKAVAKKEPKAAKEPVEKSRYGHRVGTSAQLMDDLLWKGTTMADGIKELKKHKAGRSDERSKAMLVSHAYYLSKEKNIPVDIPKDETGKYKAKKANLD